MVYLLIFVLGVIAGWALAHRWIDHRWYCGHFHPASNPCEPVPIPPRRRRAAHLRAVS